jgi:2-dehydro-3-deoxygluconokinase
MTDILCYGEAMILVAPTEAAALTALPFCSLSPAGAEFNVASHLAGLGHRAGWASALGSDPFAEIILQEARQRGVDTELVVTDGERPTGVYFKNPTEAGTQVFYYRRGSAASALDARSLMRVTKLQPAVLHTSGITAALSEVSLASTRALVSERLMAGATISFDVNYRPALWKQEEAPEILLELAQASDIVFVGRDEAEDVWGVSTLSQIRELISSPEHLIIKDSDVLAVEYIGDRVVSCRPPRVRIYEAVGAGDAFAAGWLSAYTQGKCPEQRLRLGHFMASQALQHPGDLFPVPSPEIIAQVLVADPQDWPDHVVHARGREA